MELYHFITSLFSGGALGMLYGLFFLRSRRRAFLASSGTKNLVLSSLTSALSIALITIIFFYLLRLSSIHLIILLPTFMMSFWFVILNKGI